MREPAHVEGAQFVNELGSFIREQRSSARLSLRRLSELAGISNPYLSQIERGLRRPSAEILQQIAKALRISAETLYVQAGILEPGTGEADVSREILADLDHDELAAIATGLEEYERRISTERRALHERIDALQAELVSRYKTGSASVDGLLS